MLQEKIYESFYFNLKIFKFYISTFLVKVIVLIPSPRLRGEGYGEGLKYFIRAKFKNKIKKSPSLKFFYLKFE